MAGNLPSFSLAGRIALVTGAARGIGRACALGLAEAGADVALGLRDAADGAKLVAEIAALGRRALALPMDMTDLAQIRAAVARAKAHFGRIDILVNNAGLGPPNAAEAVTEADFDLTVALNLKGTFFASQEVGRIMLAQGSGRIVNLSSQAGLVALPNESIYCMTKAAITHLTRCLAVEWGPRGIAVNAVAPTFVATPGTEKWLGDQAFMRSVIARIPLGRVGEPKDVAAAVVFLASPAAAMITGETLLIDGGWTAS
jgi:NAD(P)-dependent dehydrogenase (short-subunit alcohol dehydrogenase family)